MSGCMRGGHNSMLATEQGEANPKGSKLRGGDNLFQADPEAKGYRCGGGQS